MCPASITQALLLGLHLSLSVSCFLVHALVLCVFMVNESKVRKVCDISHIVEILKLTSITFPLVLWSWSLLPSLRALKWRKSAGCQMENAVDLYVWFQKPNALSIEFNLMSSVYVRWVCSYIRKSLYSFNRFISNAPRAQSQKWVLHGGKIIFRSVNFLIKCIY